MIGSALMIEPKYREALSAVKDRMIRHLQGIAMYRSLNTGYLLIRHDIKADPVSRYSTTQSTLWQLQQPLIDAPSMLSIHE